MSKQSSFKYPKRKLSSSMDSGAFVVIITGNFFIKKNKIPELRSLEILSLFNNTKVPELSNLRTLFH